MDTAAIQNVIKPLNAPNLETRGIAHGFFTRQGGVSNGIYASLNCGRGSKDDRAHVEENRARVAAVLGVTSAELIGPRQIHSARAVIADRPWVIEDALEADAIITKVRGLAISVLTADCVPILMADATAGIIAAVHAGWKGAKAGVIEAALDVMVRLGATPAHIAAAIGPAISVSSYEVGLDFQQAFLAESAANAKYFFCLHPDTRPYFNLNAYAKDRLAEYGVVDIHETALCTYKNESLFFSHRRSVHHGESDYGRQISAIVLL